MPAIADAAVNLALALIVCAGVVVAIQEGIRFIEQRRNRDIEAPLGKTRIGIDHHRRG